MGPFLLAAQLHVPVISFVNAKVHGRHYRSIVKPLPAPDPSLPVRKQSEQIATAYAQELETVLRKYPEQWFNFYDFWNGV